MFCYLSLPANSPYSDAICRINGLLSVSTLLQYNLADIGGIVFQASFHQIPFKESAFTSVITKAREFQKFIVEEFETKRGYYGSYYKKSGAGWIDKIELLEKPADFFPQTLPLLLFGYRKYPSFLSTGGKGKLNHLEGDAFQITNIDDNTLRNQEWLAEVCRKIWVIIKDELIRDRDYKVHEINAKHSICDACDLGGEIMIECENELFILYLGEGD